MPIPLLSKLEEELNGLLDLNIIGRVTNPTDWVALIVVVLKGEAIRLCFDYIQNLINLVYGHIFK